MIRVETEAILNSIDKLYQKLKGTQFEMDALETKREVEQLIDEAYTQAKADAACDEYLENERND